MNTDKRVYGLGHSAQSEAKSRNPGIIRHKTLIPVGTGMTKDKKYLDPATNVQDDIDAPGAMRPRGIKAGNAGLIQAGRGWIATLHSR